MEDNFINLTWSGGGFGWFFVFELILICSTNQIMSVQCDNYYQVFLFQFSVVFWSCEWLICCFTFGFCLVVIEKINTSSRKISMLELDSINLITARNDQRAKSLTNQLFTLCFWVSVLQKPVMRQGLWGGGWASCDWRRFPFFCKSHIIYFKCSPCLWVFILFLYISAHFFALCLYVLIH